MQINSQCHAAKVAPNTNRHNLENNILEYNKLNASILNLHVINWKAYIYIMYKLCISKSARYIELEISEIEFYYCCFLKQVAFFGSFDKFKMIQLC